MPAAIRRVQLDSAAYQAMLGRYVVQRLKLDPARKADDQELLQAILDAADRRFAYVAFVTERCERGKEDRQSLAHVGSGQALYARWLRGLDLEYGRKLAGRIRQVLALLGAAQQAHDWVFGAGRVADPATGGVLTMLDENFRGVPLPVLQQLLMLDRPGAERADERFDPNLLLTLQQLQGVLAVHRGAGETSRFRIAVKDFGPVMGEDSEIGPMQRVAHARMATAALDALDVLAAGQGTEPDRALFLELAGFLDACVRLAASGPLAERWQSARPRATALIEAQNRDQEATGYTLTRVRSLTQLAAWDRSSDDDADSRDKCLASRLIGRGNARAEGGDLAGAIADYGVAIGLREQIRDRQLAAGGEEAWSLPLRNDLAAVYSNRGAARYEGGDRAGALEDFDAAIALCEQIRDRQLAVGGEDAWNLRLRNDLATFYQNRGSARADGGDLAGAVEDFDAAIGLMEQIRDRELAVGGDDAWSLPLRNDLAGVYSNRGNVRRQGGDLTGAMADHDAAIGLMEQIRDRQLAVGGDDAWSLPLRNDLAGVYQNRGSARAEGGDLAGAIADCDAAIGLMEQIRDRQLAVGGDDAWSLPLRNDLAGVYSNRGNVRRQGGDLAGALADYGAAIGLMEQIRDRQLAAGGEDAWSLPLRNDLAGVYQNRGTARGDGGDLAGAVADLDTAIALREQIRDRQLAAGGGDAWSLPLRNDLAGVYSNRGSARADGGDLAGAIADHDVAIGLMEQIRDCQCAAGGEEAWSLPPRNNLGMFYQNRGSARADGGDLAGAIADHDVAIGLMEQIRDCQLAAGGEDAWSLPLRNVLAAAYQNRGLARADGGDLAGAIADYDVAIGLMEQLRDCQLAAGGEDAWSLRLRSGLAATYSSRGTARADGGDLAGAAADHDAAVQLHQQIRDRQLASGGEDAWSLPLRIDLAHGYCARAAIVESDAGRADLMAARRIEMDLQTLGFTDAAQSVAGFCDWVEQQWADRGHKG